MEQVNNRTPKGGGFSVGYNVANFSSPQPQKLAFTGGSALHSREAVVLVYAEGLASAAIASGAAFVCDRISATSRTVPIARIKRKRQNHLNLLSQPLQWVGDDKSTAVGPVREGFLVAEVSGFRSGEFLWSK
jgi:hypothetical protein